LLLLHGFWTGSWIWQPLVTYLAHRGWESWAPSITGVEMEHRSPALGAIVRALVAETRAALSEAAKFQL
jgi:hypothetical protein